MPQIPLIRRAAALGFSAELRVIRNQGLRMKLHWHEDLQIIATVHGTGKVAIHGGAPILLPPRSLAVLPPRVSHTAYAEGRREWMFQSLHIAPERLPGLGITHFRAFVTKPGERLSLAFADLMRDLLEKSELHSNVFVSALQQRIARAGDLPIEDLRMHEIAVILSKDLSALLSVSQLAKQQGTSAGHLSRAFREVYGVPPHRWRQIARVETAKRLLRAGSSVADTAKLSGFRHSSHLARHCKLLTGLTPKSFRNSRKDE